MASGVSKYSTITISNCQIKRVHAVAIACRNGADGVTIGAARRVCLCLEGVAVALAGGSGRRHHVVEDGDAYAVRAVAVVRCHACFLVLRCLCRGVALSVASPCICTTRLDWQVLVHIAGVGVQCQAHCVDAVAPAVDGVGLAHLVLAAGRECLSVVGVAASVAHHHRVYLRHAVVIHGEVQCIYRRAVRVAGVGMVVVVHAAGGVVLAVPRVRARRQADFCALLDTCAVVHRKYQSVRAVALVLHGTASRVVVGPAGRIGLPAPHSVLAHRKVRLADDALVDGYLEDARCVAYACVAHGVAQHRAAGVGLAVMRPCVAVAHRVVQRRVVGMRYREVQRRQTVAAVGVDCVKRCRDGALRVGDAVPLVAVAGTGRDCPAGAAVDGQVQRADAVAAAGVAQRVAQVVAARRVGAAVACPHVAVARRVVDIARGGQAARDYEVQGYHAVAPVGGGVCQGYRITARLVVATAAPAKDGIDRGDGVALRMSLDGKVQGRSAVAPCRVGRDVLGGAGARSVGLAVPLVAVACLVRVGDGAAVADGYLHPVGAVAAVGSGSAPAVYGALGGGITLSVARPGVGVAG